jgi:hypothetical protein
LKAITKHQNELENMHYPNEGNVDMNMVRYDIVFYLGVLHRLDEGNTCVNCVGYDMVNVSIGYCIVQLDDMKYNISMRVLHKTKII